MKKNNLLYTLKILKNPQITVTTEQLAKNPFLLKYEYPKKSCSKLFNKTFTGQLKYETNRD